MKDRSSSFEFSILESLACKVRILSVDQVQQGWPESSSSEVRSSLKVLAERGSIVQAEWEVSTIPFSGAPVQFWAPGDRYPDIDLIERIVTSRWNGGWQSHTVFAATKTTARMFGATGGGLPPVHHRNHDLLLSEVYVNYRKQNSKVDRIWQGEDQISCAETGVKNPDAFLVNEGGNVIRVVESAGRYSHRQIDAFHGHCEENQLAYELW